MTTEKDNHSPTIRLQWVNHLLPLLLILIVAAGLRFWKLDTLPPGLYRDEATNGLDALQILDGNFPIYFEANNGREPAYIYLTAIFVAILGRDPISVRLAAATIGTLTTLPVFWLGRAWFSRRTGLFAAAIWATTVWPIHLSRIGFRAILLPPVLALTALFATYAWRTTGKKQRLFWLASGACYGFAFYTYLAVRFTPVLIFFVLLFLWKRDGHQKILKALWPFALGAGVVAAPLIWFALNHLDLFLGRAGQVSVFDVAINGGHLGQALTQNLGRAIAMFIFRGDTIIRHNPPGRPVFDLLMAAPFLLGTYTLLRQRSKAATLTLIWVATMLFVTILAEDPPHYLRSVGILPIILIFPAVGLSQLWSCTKLPPVLTRGLALFILVGSTLFTVRDYHLIYAQQAETAYLFEDAAWQLAQQVNAQSQQHSVYLDKRLWDGWPSLHFLLNPTSNITLIEADWPKIMPNAKMTAIYVWPFNASLPLPPPAGQAMEIWAEEGALQRGDLDANATPLYIQYLFTPLSEVAFEADVVNFDNRILLRDANVYQTEAGWDVALTWEVVESVSAETTIFVHTNAPTDSIVLQDDQPFGGWYRPNIWQKGTILHQTHHLDLAKTSQPTPVFQIGVYNALDGTRWPIITPNGTSAQDSWELSPDL